MNIIKLDDTIGDIIAKMSAGNPGAITVLMQVFEEAPNIDPQDWVGGLGPILNMDNHGIYGPDIWILYKDVCGSNITNLVAVLRSLQLGMTSEKRLLDAIKAKRTIDVSAILKAVMERLTSFNRYTQPAIA